MYKAVDRDYLDDLYRRTTIPKHSAPTLGGTSPTGMKSTAGGGSILGGSSRAGFSSPSTGRLNQSTGTKGEGTAQHFKTNAKNIVAPKRQNQFKAEGSRLNIPTFRTGGYGGLDTSRLPNPQGFRPTVAPGSTNKNVAPGEIGVQTKMSEYGGYGQYGGSDPYGGTHDVYINNPYNPVQTAFYAGAAAPAIGKGMMYAGLGGSVMYTGYRGWKGLKHLKGENTWGGAAKNLAKRGLTNKYTLGAAGLAGVAGLGYAGYRGAQSWGEASRQKEYEKALASTQNLHNQTASGLPEQTALTYVDPYAQQPGSFRDRWVNEKI